ncbi:uncharacterized protein MEPE_03035 [Melanopsichium pennsylvanicum]|uniref:Uncharacterized protein n=1 Tax=Melanopsichium pennsylvanicum TaxID=63383 RepID=A0AAJ4XM64_9BASI|nr:uncharacterized protein MEPE_03035 [Melanopsichium pennsylvanicum]
MIAPTTRNRRKAALALLSIISALTTASAGPSWFKRQDPISDPQVLKLISATGPYATMAGTNGNAIQSAVGMSGDIAATVASAVAAATTTTADPSAALSKTTDAAASAVVNATAADLTPSAIVQAVQASPSANPDKVAIDSLSESQLSQLQGDLTDATGSDEVGVQSWTYDPGAFGCGFNDDGGDVATATLCSVNTPASPTASSARSEQVLPAATVDGNFAIVAPAQRRIYAMEPQPTAKPKLGRRQNPDNDPSSNLFPLFTSYVTLDPPTTTTVNFGPTSNLNVSSIPRRGSSDSGNGEAPGNINNPNSPDLGWLDVQVGAVPYKNGDLIASIIWILATIALIPLLLIRLLRRSSLISMVLITVIVFMILMLIAFGVRAKLSDTTPTTSMMNVEGIILAVLLPLLIEPLLHLLGLYSQQSGRSTGIPQASLVLRILNLIVFILFLVGAAYYASWLDKWNKALQLTQTAQDLPSIVAPKVTRIAPVVGSVIEIIVILGAALLIPVARGESGSLRPGGFIFVLLLLLFISTVYRLLQSLHATTRIAAEQGGELDSNDLLPFFQGGSSNTTTNNQGVANGLSLAPQGMYGPNSQGIDWDQLQLTMASRGTPQTPLIFNLVYILPMWLMVFLLFFAHAPSKRNDDDGGDGGDGEGNVAIAKAS